MLKIVLAVPVSTPISLQCTECVLKPCEGPIKVPSTYINSWTKLKTPTTQHALPEFSCSLPAPYQHSINLIITDFSKSSKSLSNIFTRPSAQVILPRPARPHVFTPTPFITAAMDTRLSADYVTCGCQTNAVNVLWERAVLPGARRGPA
jgi:hypothetical protein